MDNSKGIPRSFSAMIHAVFRAVLPDLLGIFQNLASVRDLIQNKKRDISIDKRGIMFKFSEIM